MRRLLLAVASAYLLLVPAAATTARETAYVSIINLIAAPERYQGKLVSVVGYAVIEFEDVGIYLSDADAKHKVTHNSISLLLTEEEIKKHSRLTNKYVVVEGIFDANYRGHGSMKSGAITNIVRLEEW